NIAQQTLGIARVVGIAWVLIGRLFVKMAGHDLAIEPRHNVLVLVEKSDVAAGHARSRHGNPPHKHPVANEKTCEERYLCPHATVPQIKEGYDQIADGDALQDAIDTPVLEVEVGEAIDEYSQEKYDGRAAQRMTCKFGARVATPQPCLSGKNHRDAYNKEKRGKDEICGRESVPRSVLHLLPRAGAGVVHHDHEGDGEPAQHIKRKQTFLRGSSGSRFVEPWSLDAKRRFSQEIASFHRTTQNTRILEPRQGRRQFDHLVLRPYQFERCSIPYPRGPIFAKWKAVAAPPKVHKPRSIHRQALFARHKKARTDPVRAFFAERRS